jgi:cytochrome b6-f complex iron-sulfur subunit
MEEKLINRRQAFNKLSIAAISLLAGFAGFIGGGFLYPVPRKKPPEIFVCLESEIPTSKPLEIKDSRGRKALLMRKADGTIIALSTVCSHLGCKVFYRPQKKIFECPCHQGFFDEEGYPISGPPQLPLDCYPTVVRRGKVFIQFG